MLAENAKVYISHVYCNRISQISTRNNELGARNNDLSRQISLFEAKD